MTSLRAKLDGVSAHVSDRSSHRGTKTKLPLHAFRCIINRKSPTEKSMSEQLQNSVTSLKTRAQAPRQGSREDSHLSGIFIEDALAVNVLISRAHGEKQWRLELHDDTSQPVIWRTTFATQQNAWDAFMQVVRTEGIESVAGPMKNFAR